MIQFIDKLMHDWAVWTKVRRDGGLGYPSHSSGCRLMVSSGGRGDIVGVDEQSLEIEQIIVELRRDRPEMYKVVDWFYLAGNISGDRIARELGCHRNTIYLRLHAVHQHVMMALQENDLNKNVVADAMIEKKVLKIA